MGIISVEGSARVKGQVVDLTREVLPATDGHWLECRSFSFGELDTLLIVEISSGEGTQYVDSEYWDGRHGFWLCFEFSWLIMPFLIP